MQKIKTLIRPTTVFAVLMLWYTAVNAQQRTITGTITEEGTGEPVIGANVQVKEAPAQGTTTNIDGQFSLTVPAEAKTLIISYIGFITKELPIAGTDFSAVTLKESTVELEELVVIGYGTAKRKDLTGSVSSIGANAIAAIPVATATEAITGKLAGVQVTTTEGSPDADIIIRVRGGGSITGDNAPLYIVDGFPVSSISDIPPGDIESIDVLKDASSTAIYGSRGANGVILVTTKSGKEGKTSVSYNAYIGYKKIASTMETLSPTDYVHWQYERALLVGKIDEYTKYFGNYQDIDLYDNVPSNDWQEQVFGRIGNTFNHNLNINGGDEKTRYAFSYNRITDKAIMVGSDFKRDNLSLKLNQNPLKNVKLDFTARYSNTAINGSGMNEQNVVSSADYRLKYAMIYPPIPVSGLTDEGETDDSFFLDNPLTSIADNDRRQTRQTFNANAGVGWDVIKDLRLRTEFGLDDYRLADDRFYGATTYYVKNVPEGNEQGLPAIMMSKSARRIYRNTNTLNYDLKALLPETHSLNILLGQELIFAKEEEMKSTVHAFPSSFSFYDARRLSTQGNAYSVDNNLKPDDRLLSFFSRINYNYKDKYLLAATFRADGSSKFAENNRWGYFPSVAAAWRISSESFMEATRTWLDDLKLRLSYGTAGNNRIPSGQMSQTYSSSSTTWVNGFPSYWSPSKTMANPDLKWETTVTRNIGFDITTLRGRLTATIELYRNSTNDLLIQFPTPGTGYDNQYRNMGETRNQGVEFSLNLIAVDKKDFGLSISGNIGFNRNKIISLGDMENSTFASGWASTEINNDYIIETGGSVGKMLGYISGGRYEVSDFEGYDATAKKWTLKAGVANAEPVLGHSPRPGDMKLVDYDRDGTVTSDYKDRTVIGDANPLHTGGFTLNGRVYGFDLSANFNWSYGNDIYNANKIEWTSTSKYHSRNRIGMMSNGERWTNLLPDGSLSYDPAQLEQMNAGTTLWSPYMGKYVLSDWAVEDGSFLRLNTLTLGYTLPSTLTHKVKIKTLRIYATGYNVACWTDYTGFDPEVSTLRKTPLTPGVDYSAYPKSRQIVFGLNLTF
ncbi:MAG: TonB-dependent receptor [Tannerella sp.]|jgi:TonB-linked SusC/RagA family outer membrane protein|nr:TonB-dependent receptor [Tannerella sp.]